MSAAESHSRPVATTTSSLKFPKQQRLKSRKLLDAAFGPHKEKPLKAWPILMRVVPASLPARVPTQTAFSVAKRRFPRAVDRNRIKRLMREAWRHERAALEKDLVQGQQQWAIVFIFVGQELPDAARCRKAIRKLVAKSRANTGQYT